MDRPDPFHNRSSNQWPSLVKFVQNRSDHGSAGVRPDLPNNRSGKGSTEVELDQADKGDNRSGHMFGF